MPGQIARFELRRPAGAPSHLGRAAVALAWALVLPSCASDGGQIPAAGSGGTGQVQGDAGSAGGSNGGGGGGAGAAGGGTTGNGGGSAGSGPGGNGGNGGVAGGAGAAAGAAGGGAGSGVAGSGGSGGAAAGGRGGATAGAAGAAGVTGAAGTSGTPDAGTDAGTSTALCPPSALICEDFEDGNLDGWTQVLTSGTVAIDSVHASSGKNALGINIPANQRGGFIERKGAPLFPLPGKVMWGRVMVYFDSVSDGHTDFVRGAVAGGGTPWYNLGEQHGEILLNYYNGSAADCWARPSPGKPVALGKWTCWEWSFDGNINEIQFYIDGALSRRVSATGDGCTSGQNSTWTAPDFAALRIGAYIAETRATVMQMWIDDIAVGTAGRIGCPAP